MHNFSVTPVTENRSTLQTLSPDVNDYSRIGKMWGSSLTLPEQEPQLAGEEIKV